MNPSIYEHENIEDTSMKKYPYNKYYDFKDQDSSGRKYIRQQLNLCQNDMNLTNVSKQNYIDLYLNKQPRRQLKKKKVINHKKSSNKSITFTKSNKNKSCNQSIIQSTQMNSNRNNHHNSIKWTNNQDQNIQELKHYKKLCLNMRKKNSDLQKQLRESKQENRKSIMDLNLKVSKMNQKYNQKKETMDTNKMQQIMTSLKTIKGKLKKNPNENKQKKFYDFFMESLGILYPEGQLPKMSYVQIQVLWKQILQFLILHDFKPEPSNATKPTTIR